MNEFLLIVILLCTSDMNQEIIDEILQRKILHWNFKGLCELPQEVYVHGVNVRELYLKWNNLRYLPSWIGKLTNITNIYLFRNELQELPEEIGELVNLRMLDLDNNLLTTLPESIGKLKNLIILHVQNNMLTKIPQDLSNLKALSVLNLKGNKIKYIPSSIWKLNSLSELVLDSNEISYLPRNIVYLPNLRLFAVSKNKLKYLPAVRFLGRTRLLFTKNFELNYLSCSIVDGPALDLRAIWKFDTGGSFSGTVEETSHPVVYVPELNAKLVMPPNVKVIRNDTGHQPISLLEACLRIFYPMIYRISDRRECLHPEYTHWLPSDLVETLELGPTALCFYCETPLFHEFTLWVMGRTVENTRHAGLRTIPSTLYFCSSSGPKLKSCLRIMAELNEMSKLKLPWTLLSQ